MLNAVEEVTNNSIRYINVSTSMTVKNNDGTPLYDMLVVNVIKWSRLSIASIKKH